MRHTIIFDDINPLIIMKSPPPLPNDITFLFLDDDLIIFNGVTL